MKRKHKHRGMYLSRLEQIQSPEDLRGLSDDELAVIAAEIRLRLIQVTAQNGGHLASSLGATDIIVAMHAVYNAPVDKLVFDTGHQAYAHKLLTGRQAGFSTLRQHEGLSGFIRKDESDYDVYDTGHASDALSIAMGLVLSRDLSDRHERVVALVGDAAMSGGMAFEALNQIGHEARDLTIILNDNEMSIAHNVGAFSLYLAKMRSSRPYIRTRDTIEGSLSRLGNPGRYLVDVGERMRDSMKLFLVGGSFFEDLGFTYLGPVDGHSIEHLRQVMLSSQQLAGPVLIHAYTTKGKGYLPAEADPELFHGASRFTVSTGVFLPKNEGKSYTEYFSDALVAEGGADPSIVAITAAMPKGTGLDAFKQSFPERFFDAGIAEEHAVTSAAGMALGGNLPVVAIYSSFLQRAYDQLMTNVCLMGQHVVFCLDRAGLVGEDGTTHHGVFDLAYLRTMPNMKVIAPASAQQLVDALHTALALDGPVALRFPRGEAYHLDGEKTTPLAPRMLDVGRAELLRSGSDVAFLALGSMVKQGLEAASLLEAEGISTAVYNMIWAKPIDTGLLASLTGYRLVVTLEEGTLMGGFGSAVLEAFADQAADLADSPRMPRVVRIGIPDDFVAHGTPQELMEDLQLDASSIAQKVRALYGEDQA
ncbi:MAG: 1-deoxy-D-xylulose-5-phosphate synthase [Coriobacteriia bacterium]|nr:1-deoxy-D-xylulose-5-phosphate synthase [Coriobacteriia bacterium]